MNDTGRLELMKERGQLSFVGKVDDLVPDVGMSWPIVVALAVDG